MPRDDPLTCLLAELQPEEGLDEAESDGQAPAAATRRTVASGGCPYKQDASASVLAGSGEPTADGRNGHHRNRRSDGRNCGRNGDRSGGCGDGRGDGRAPEGDRRLVPGAGVLLTAAALAWLIVSALRRRHRLLRGGRARVLALVLLAAAVGALTRSQRAVARLRQLEELSRPEVRMRQDCVY